MTRSKLLVLGIIVAIIAALAWFAYERRGESPTLVDANVPYVSTETGSPATRKTAERQKQAPTLLKLKDAANSEAPSAESMGDELPDFQVPPDQAISRLRVLSDAGNSDAKMALSQRLSECTARALRVNQQSDDLAIIDIEITRANQKMDEKARAVWIQNGQRRIDQHLAERIACEGLPSEVLEDWLDPIDQVAQSGNTYAMREYASYVVAEYDSREAVVADVDRAILRRDKARAYLHKAVNLGEAEALADLAHAYFYDHIRPQLYAADSYQAYLYAYAGSFGERGRFRELDWVMSKSAEMLDSRQIIDARKQGKRLYDACCRKH